ncbi:MAG TPA: YfhO family protein, partial [Kofleriaceae bacterium]|nr:YfhO family protein [Kofleriaceae bacterium]
ALAAAGKGGEAPPVAGRIRELGRNRLVAEIDAPADGIVVVHESWFPSWRAWVDGEEVDIAPANAAFRGLAVGPGRHTIVMEYEPPGWLFLAIVSLLGTAGATALAGVGLWRERRAA